MRKYVKDFRNEFIVFFLYVASRLPALGIDLFNTDAWKWKARIFDFGSGVFYFDFIKTIQKYHPGVTLMWLGTISVKFYNLYYRIFFGTIPPDNDVSVIFGLHFVQKLILVMAIGLVMAFIFFALKKMFGNVYAFLCVFLISLEPFNVALTRVLHLEGLMSILMLASFVWLFFYLQDEARKKRLVLSSFFGALAILTKTSALFLIPFCGLMFILVPNQISRKINFTNLRKIIIKGLKNYLLWLVLVCGFFVLLWPAMWTHPSAALTTVYRGIFTIGIERGHDQLYFGNFTNDPGVFFYFVVLFYRSSLYLLAGLIGFFVLLKKRIIKLNKTTKPFVLALFLFAFLYMVELTIPTKKLDRYLLPSMLSFIFIGTFFFEYVVEYFKKKTNLANILIITFVLSPAIAVLSYLHADYLSYYNPLLGGLKRGMNVIEPKWMFGQRDIEAYFKKVIYSKNLKQFVIGETIESTETLEDKLTVGFPEKYYTQVHPFISRIGGRAVIMDLTPQAKKTKYFVYPVWEDTSSEEARFKLKPIKPIYTRGIRIFNVYERL